MRLIVRVETHPMAGPEGDRIRYVAVCATDGCKWRSHRQAVKVAAEDEARYHRGWHRRQIAEGGGTDA